MRIGTLRKQITIQQEQPTSDGAGGYALAWTNLATVWGEIVPMSGSKIFTTGHLEGHVSHKITLRWSADLAITADMRLVTNNRVFNIHTVLNTDERNRFADILVEEGGAV